jgi:histone deacetylase complex subunit SAP18
MNNTSDKNSFQSQTQEINREKICPFLLKVFYRENDYNSLEDFNNGIFPTSRELHIYTWMDATLREITMLIKEAIEPARKKDAQLNFSLVFPDSKGKLQRKELGSIYSSRKGPDDIKTLQNLRFTIGDYLDICIANKSRDKGEY